MGHLRSSQQAHVIDWIARPLDKRLKLDMSVGNPNDNSPQITGLDVQIKLSGKKFVRGLSNAEFTAPELKDTVVSDKTISSTLDVVRQLVSLGKGQKLTYGITNMLPREDGKLLFNNSGVLVKEKDRSNFLNPWPIYIESSPHSACSAARPRYRCPSICFMIRSIASSGEDAAVTRRLPSLRKNAKSA